MPECSVPRSGVVRDEAVEHDDVGGDAPAEVEGRHHRGQPHPFPPLLQVDGVDKVSQSWQSPANHVDGEEWQPTKLVTPAPKVERQEDWNDIVGDGDDVVETDHLEMMDNISQVTTESTFTSFSTAVYWVVLV